MKEKVAILGASKNPERYSYLALKMLQEYGHTVFPVNPGLEEIEGVPVSASLNDLKNIDTVTLYMNPTNLQAHVDKILQLKPRRVIFNPGTESRDIEATLQKAGIETLEACTLVMLRTNQFEK
ncbi:MAG: CoA-binding protein [Bdellovibrio sp. ArHS]|uniref:CoA-binding protein n=1 Tax=Bdellovibrio sp. ArHS TaxID=1569284 RepID=UPI000582EDA5|nr:CoA-binding protein [Bdellovibrio sp. ArHS]KHD89596.1 MAG: CoA-binding protein [Bdellovibrio sp. ArHS]